MARYIGGLLLAALVLWTGEARGECAWVVWEELRHSRLAHEVESATTWNIQGVRQTQPECEEALNRVWQDERDSWKKTYGNLRTLGPGVFGKPGEIHVSIENPDRTVTILVSKFRCLPDTIDPRSPRGAQ